MEKVSFEEFKTFAKKFNFSEQIAELYSLTLSERELSIELSRKQQKINHIKNNLPKEIVQLFEKELIVETLKQ